MWLMGGMLGEDGGRRMREGGGKFYRVTQERGTGSDRVALTLLSSPVSLCTFSTVPQCPVHAGRTEERDSHLPFVPVTARFSSSREGRKGRMRM